MPVNSPSIAEYRRREAALNDQKASMAAGEKEGAVTMEYHGDGSCWIINKGLPREIQVTYLNAGPRPK